MKPRHLCFLLLFAATTALFSGCGIFKKNRCDTCPAFKKHH